MSKTFSIGGIHPSDNKISVKAAIENFPLMEMAYISLSQHLGAPAEPVVAKGDKVKTGQLIAKANGFISANVHSSVSGTVSSNTSYVLAGENPGSKIKEAEKLKIKTISEQEFLKMIQG